MIAAAAASLPAGFVRLTDDPATHLLAVIDEVPEAAEEEPEHAGEEQAPADAALPPDSVIPAETSVEPTPGEQTIAADAKAVDAPEAAVSADAGEAQTAALDEPATEQPTTPAHHDDWYFAEQGTDAPVEAAAGEPDEVLAGCLRRASPRQ